MSTVGSEPPSNRAESVRRLQAGLRRLTRVLDRLNDAVGSQVELLPADLEVLDLLDREGPMSPRHVTDRTGVHPATLTGILDRLERGGWVRRSPDPTDRRRVVLEAVTDRGGELLRLYSPMNKALTSLAADYQPNELAAIIDFLERAADAGERSAEQVRARE